MTDLQSSVRIVISILALSLLGCGANGTASVSAALPPGCGTVNDCGGDVTGTWTVLGGCSNALVGLSCPANTPQEIVGEGFTGTLTFNSDLTYTASIVETGIGAGTFSVPSACLPAGVGCSQLIRPCTGSGPCSCPVLIPQANGILGSGTYSLNGHDISFAPSQSSGQTNSYCVQGDLLHLTSSQTTVENGTSTTHITSDIVAQKQ